MNLSSYDEAALEALAPKGVVRRARRDVEAGTARIAERSDKNAVVETDGQTVRIDARGPSAARCTCPAGGICRHILIAVMALNASAQSSAPADGNAATAAEELCGLAQADLMAFAGADWKAAATLAAASAETVVAENGRNCTVELAGAPAGVTFIAGLGLKGAAFKGQKARARVCVAAAALIVRAQRGLAVELGEAEEETADEGVAQDYLEDAAQKLAQATRLVLTGASPVAADMFFDLAISARAEAAPRLTAQLRALAKQAGQSTTRAVQFEPEDFLADAARTFALIEALKQSPHDVALTGLLRRDFVPAPAFELLMLGARHWTTEAGARGLTLHGFAPETRQWRSLTLARGPGMDPAFDPRQAYRLPVWSARSAQSLIGQRLMLPQPLVSDDGGVAPTLPESPRVEARIAGVRALIASGAAFARWAELRLDLVARVGDGLHRRLTPMPALIAPTRFGGLGFDDFAQNYEWEAFDHAGDRIMLTLPAEDHEIARRLAEMRRPPLLLAESAGDRLALGPIAILSDGTQGVEIVNLTLDPWVHPERRSGVLEAVRNLVAPRAAPPLTRTNPLANLTRRALDAAVITCGGGQCVDLDALERASEDAGLFALASAVRRMRERGDVLSALACAYVSEELATSLDWLQAS